jgi:predicted GNAT family N-acyltransferase
MRRPANATGGRHRLSRILPAAVARPAVRAVVVDKERARSEVLRQLRAWTVEGRPEACRNLVGEIVETSSIAEALAELSRDLENTILVASGYLHAELRDLVPEEIWSAAEIIVDGDEMIEGVEIFPTASVIPKSGVVITRHPIAAFRKKLLRRWVSSFAEVRQVETPDDLEAYFAFRFTEWNSRDFIPEERKSAKASLEIDVTDRTALPLGLYKKERGGERLIGCIRLVRETGEEDPSYIRAVEALIRRKRDPVLYRAFGVPYQYALPFDLLEVFPEFQDFYAEIVRDRRRAAEISRVIVDPRERGKALGEILVDTAISRAEQESIHVLFLACREELKGLYQRCGFAELEGVWCKQFLSIKVPSIVMCQMLSELR